MSHTDPTRSPPAAPPHDDPGAHRRPRSGAGVPAAKQHGLEISNAK
jgi:hypothetical protein